MKKEYDFSKGVRGKFFRPNVKVNLPIYLDKDIREFVQRYAKRKRIDAQTVVNRIIRTHKQIMRELE